MNEIDQQQLESVSNQLIESVINQQSESVLNQQTESVLYKQTESILNQQTKSILNQEIESILNPQPESVLNQQLEFISNQQTESALNKVEMSTVHDISTKLDSFQTKWDQRDDEKQWKVTPLCFSEKEDEDEINLVRENFYKSMNNYNDQIVQVYNKPLKNLFHAGKNNNF